MRLVAMELARNLKIDSVSRLFPTPPHQIDSGCPVADAVTLMRREKVGCLVVCRDGRLVGIVTERDLVRRVLPPHLPLTTPIADCMTPYPLTVSSPQSIRAPIDRTAQRAYRHLPLLDEKQP